MATRASLGHISMTACLWEPTLWCKILDYISYISYVWCKLHDSISYISRVIANCVFEFPDVRCHGNKGCSEVNFSEIVNSLYSATTISLKGSDILASYNISVLCPAIKILERLLLPILEQHLPNSNIQHGFRRVHSTTSALLELNSTISSGFNQKRPSCHTLLLQIDLSQAFDRVNPEKLLADLNNSSLPGAIVKWFSCYLKGRQSRTLFCNWLSSSRNNIHSGVPQGAVTSSKLFNFYLYNLPPSPAGVDIVVYADDLSGYAVGPEVQILCNRINTYVPVLLQFFQERDLVVSSEKSSVTLFTLEPNQAREHPQISFNGTIVPLEKQPKILGVTLDTMYTFTPHCRIQAAKVRARNSLLKALAETSWGQQKETLILTYQALGRLWGNFLIGSHSSYSVNPHSLSTPTP